MATVIANLKFILSLTAILLISLSLMRSLLLLHNRELTVAIPAKELVRSFVIGCRFDMIIIGALMLVPIMAQFFPQSQINRSLPLYWCAAFGSIVIFFSVTELEFYRQFHTRLNSLVFDYIKEDPKTVSSMIWNGCPVLRYMFLWTVVSLLMTTGFFLAQTLTLTAFGGTYPSTLLQRLLFFLPLLSLAAIACRGTLRSGPPLRWGDAYHSTHLFANHLALNGIYTMIKALLDVKKQKSRKKWLKVMPKAAALKKTRNLLLQPGDNLIEPEGLTLRREHQPSTTNSKLRNVVVIMMESFSAQYIGASGKQSGITPEFDRLAEKGVLFNHFFSNGTHTHQGIFATLAGFPNLPGFETLMQQPQGATGFSGMAELLRKRDYQSLYTYNGDFSWDNQEGFFRNQGMTKFIGRFDYVNPEFIDPTWGVSDNDMFNRAHQELGNLDPEKPFFAVLQTLSNHLPFTIPEPLPIAKVTGHGSLDGHLTAMRYADWALGQFFVKAQTSSYFSETLFVLLGDHGFCVPQQLTDIELLRFHIPLLLLAPGLQEEFGSKRSIVGTQVDIVPTIMGLLGKPFIHNCWGRNLLNVATDDPGFGIIKPSGNDPTVAMLNGNQILVKPPDGHNPQLYNFKLYPQAVTELNNNQQDTSEMTTMLNAYVQTAMDALLTNRCGV
ncbi:MAG: LTA synthase family protein [Desulfuromusa sp.]|nr:LTA synthase family protein [Desulfuromusa sp.]